MKIYFDTDQLVKNKLYRFSDWFAKGQNCSLICYCPPNSKNSFQLKIGSIIYVLKIYDYYLITLTMYGQTEIYRSCTSDDAWARPLFTEL